MYLMLVNTKEIYCCKGRVVSGEALTCVGIVCVFVW